MPGLWQLNGATTISRLLRGVLIRAGVDYYCDQDHDHFEGKLTFARLMEQALPQEQTKKCPACQRLFTCNAGNILVCHCYAIRLTEKERSHVASQYQDCLCATCLKQMTQSQNNNTR